MRSATSSPPVCRNAERVADDGAHIRLQVRGAVTRVHVRRSPHFDRENAKGAQQGAGIVNGSHRRDLSSTLLVRANHG